jgi:hypothetical protein
MGVLNLVHELMHSFGAKHDPEPASKPECTPDDKESYIWFFIYVLQRVPFCSLDFKADFRLWMFGQMF